MQDLNNLTLIGRVCQTVGADERSFGYVGNGIARANVNIAVNRAKKVNGQWTEETYFFPVTIWGKTAENLKPYLVKGQQICVSGFLKQDKWQDQNGNKQSRISIVAETVQLCGSRQNGYMQGEPIQSEPMHDVQQPYAQQVETLRQTFGQPQPNFNTMQNVPQNVPPSEEFPEDIPF